MSVKEAIRKSLGLLSSRDRRLLVLTMAIQVATSALDLAGVLLLGLVGALAVTTVQSQPAPPAVTNLVDSVGLGHLTDQALVAGLAAAAALVLLTKSIVSSLLTRRVFIFLANRQALVSARLTRELLSRPLTFLQSRSSQQTAYALIQGAGAATISTLGQLVVVVTELSVLVVLSAALLFIDPWVTLGAIAFFALVAIVLQRLMGTWASRLGQTGAEADIASLNTVQDALSTYREITVLHRRELYVDRFQRLRWTSASVTADRTFLLQVPKYVFEAALVVGGVLLAGVLFTTKDSVVAFGTLALFLAAASRVMPSLLRLQGAALTLRDNAAAAIPTFDLADDLGNPRESDGAHAPRRTPVSVTVRLDDRPVRISVEHVSFTYPGSDSFALKNVSLDVAAGTSLALVGRSAAGKSTLVDVILGVLIPQEGSVQLGTVAPQQLIESAPGSVAYVPQSVGLVSGSVRDNVALGLPRGAIADELVWMALERAHVADAIRDMRSGLDTSIGEDGVKLSGGQRQRVGIARAFLLNPSVLVMDEATSALDSETEAAITQVVNELHGHVTVVIVAHRLSTVRDVDQVAYMEDGRIVDRGTFDEVRSRVPALERQASLMGL